MFLNCFEHSGNKSDYYSDGSFFSSQLKANAHSWLLCRYVSLRSAINLVCDIGHRLWHICCGKRVQINLTVFREDSSSPGNVREACVSSPHSCESHWDTALDFSFAFVLSQVTACSAHCDDSIQESTWSAVNTQESV